MHSATNKPTWRSLAGHKRAVALFLIVLLLLLTGPTWHLSAYEPSPVDAEKPLGEVRYPIGTSPTRKAVSGQQVEAANIICCGSDDRQRISPTTMLPWSAMAYLETAYEFAGVGKCTGTFIGARVLLTAAHCIYNRTAGEWAQSIAVVPGKDGSVDPYDYQFAKSWWVPTEYSAGIGNVWGWDWGLILMPDSQMGDEVGHFRIGVLTTESLLSTNFQPVIAGYPGDKPYGTLWYDMQPMFFGVTFDRLFYTIDTASGESGAAIWRRSDGVIVGVHTSGNPDYNGGSRIDMVFLNKLLAACKQAGCVFDYYVESVATPTVVATVAPTATQVPSPTSTPQPNTAITPRLWLPLGVK